MYGLYGLEHHTVEINGDVTMEMDGQTSEYSATQSVDSVRLSFANSSKPNSPTLVLHRNMFWVNFG